MFSKIFSQKPRIKTRILCIDGGGVRGIVAATMLAYLEKKLQQFSDNPNARIVDYFDLFSGTSTGALIIAGLLMPDQKNGRPKYTADNLVDLYLKNAKNIFNSSFLQGIKSVSGLLDVKYNSQGVNLLYQQYFGHCQLKELLKPCLIPSYDLTLGKNYFFRQHKAVVSDSHNYHLADVLRAATSAITYFPPAKIATVNGKKSCCFVDGGVFAVNPSLSAYAEFRYLYPGFYSENTMMLSLGTGKQDTYLDCDDIEHWGAVEWRDPGSNLLTTAQSFAVDYQLKAVYDSKPNYLRLNPNIDKLHTASLDNSEDDYLDFLHQLGKQTCINEKEKLDNFAKSLINSSKIL
ncbi:patatin-like phospholipase family protein [Candidatus Thioglobus sp.]|uniref:patatin-like phospholipase family protein n=1 Tax=Candidatus Thioglobus sp. TaxID=2026721 RepID=UPI003D0CE536